MAWPDPLGLGQITLAGGSYQALPAARPNGGLTEGLDTPEDNAYCAQEEIQGIKVPGKGFAGDTQISRTHPGFWELKINESDHRTVQFAMCWE